MSPNPSVQVVGTGGREDKKNLSFFVASIEIVLRQRLRNMFSPNFPKSLSVSGYGRK